MKEELSLEEKQKILDEINAPDEESEGNTEISYIAENEALMEQVGKLTPKQLYEQNLAANVRSTMMLGSMVKSLSKKNLQRVMLAVLKLPSEGDSLEFGGTQEQKNLAYQAFIQAQVASNSKTYILSINAAAKAKAEKLKQGENNESTEETP